MPPVCYANLTQFKSYLAPELASDTTFDTSFLRLLQSMSVEIDKFCSTGRTRHFYTYEGTRYTDGAGSTLFFPFDVLSISDFSLDPDGTGTYTAIATTDYVLYPNYRLPYTYCKTSNNTSIGSFASSIRSGVKLTAVYGYNEDTATPYSDSGVTVNTGGISGSATTHALASGKGASFAIGETIRIDTEQLFISGISTDTLTFQRGVNGTTAAAHLAGATIYIYYYPGPVIEATLIQTSRIWKRRESAFATVVGNTETGQYSAWKGLDPDVKDLLSYYVTKRI